MSRIFDKSFSVTAFHVQINTNISRLLRELVWKMWSKGALETVDAAAVGISPKIRWKCEKIVRSSRRWKEADAVGKMVQIGTILMPKWSSKSVIR